METINELLNNELERQNNGIELIASENYPSIQVRNACGSIAMCKYAEGYPGKRYYGGCRFIDKIEQTAIDNVCKLFNCKFANVQPHSGSTANFAAYHALLPRGGRILSLDLNSGGHLTHGSPVSFSSDLYEFDFYCLDKDGYIDFNSVKEKILNFKPDIVLCGYSAYPHIVDFKNFRDIINECGSTAFLVADIAHIAGLIAAGEHPSPFPWCDVVTTTTHKTLRGPRGGMILWNRDDLTKAINNAVFPYAQGGPLENIIAAKALMAEEALQPQFKDYIKRVKENTATMANWFKNHNCIVYGTENHLFLLNTLESFRLNGLQAQKKLEEIGITTNKNMIPKDTLSPAKTSGLRIGLAAATSRGATIFDVEDISIIIYYYLKGNIDKDAAALAVKNITNKWKDINNLKY